MDGLENELEKAKANLLRLQAQRQAAVSREAGLKAQGSQAVLSGKASDVGQELAQVQIEIELLDSAVGQASDLVKHLESDIHDRRIGQAGGMWEDFRKATQPKIETIYVELGALAGKLEGMKVEYQVAYARYHEEISGEAPNSYQLWSTFDNIGRSIQEARRFIESARPYLKVD